MGITGTATDALESDNGAEFKNQRHLQVVNNLASVTVAAEFEPDYFNGLAGDQQIPCGD